MTTSYKDIARVVASKFADSSQSDITTSLAHYLVEERRVADLDRILREVSRLRLEESNIIEVTALSRHELSESLKRQIEAIFDSNEVILHEEIDKDLVGGVRIQAQDTLIDLSVRGQLNRLRSHKF